MPYGKFATVRFQGRLEPLLQTMWSVSLGVRMHFLLVIVPREIGVFLAVPFQLLITEIILLLFDSSRGKPSTYDNNNFSTK